MTMLARHASKFCKKTCCVAPHVFPQTGFLSISWNYRTLASMSTLTLKGPTGGSLGLNLSVTVYRGHDWRDYQGFWG